MQNIAISSQEELSGIAEIITREIKTRPVVAFYGPMGAGKTTLIREICTRMAVEDTVTSPTFALVNKYRAGDGRTVFHFDFYRIENITEAFDMGYEEYFYSGHVCLIEWPEKIDGLLPDDILAVRIGTVPENPDARIFEIG